jgi:hypothetical protein
MTDTAGWFWRRLKEWGSSLASRGRAGRGSLSIAAKLDLGAKKSLLVVAYGRRRFLVASGAETVSALLDIGPLGGRTSADGGGLPALRSAKTGVRPRRGVRRGMAPPGARAGCLRGVR